MIGKDEILAFADETGLTPNVAEKDRENKIRKEAELTPPPAGEDCSPDY